MTGSASKAVTASARLWGISPILPPFTSSRVSRYMFFRVFGSPGSRRRRTPSSPAATNAAMPRYGFTEPETTRHSKRPGSGTRNICVRLLSP